MPRKEQPKLFTARTFALAVSAVLVGSSLGIYREFRVKGSVSGLTIGASVVAAVLGITIVLVIGRYANRPEK